MAEFILKDWYGKEQTFDKDTIYVKNADGELIPFKEKATIKPLAITENGEYTASDGVDGYSPVTVNVAGSSGSDRVTILPEQTITATYSDKDGCYKASVSLSEMTVIGKGYAVCFDGVWYVCVHTPYGANTGSLTGAAIQCAGNYAIRKKFYNNAITWLYASSAETYPFCFDAYGDVYLDNSDSHTIRIDKIAITE